ncbi:AMIN domain-containing protein [Leptolyngbya sp. GB1-A1]|uniref:AMIN domain-containing protein n=1 Tax=Leptolyngbya sp. GB1-A1 TaxID=2933908 RepID=UPI003299889A
MQKRFVQQVQTQFWLSVSQPVGLLGTGLILTGAAIALPASFASQFPGGAIAQASSLQWQYDPESAALSVNLPPGATPRYFLAAQPARIVIDLPNTDVGTLQTEKQFPGAVQQIRIAQFQPGVTRIVMQLAAGTVLAPQQVDLQQSGDRWVLRPVLAGANPAPAQTVASPFPEEGIASQSPERETAAVNSPSPQAPDASPVNAAPEVIADSSAANSTSAGSTPNLAAANEATSDLPPLEPGATEIPVELPPADPAAVPSEMRSARTTPPTVSVPDLSAVAASPDPALSAPPGNLTPAPQTAEGQAPEIQASEIQAFENQASTAQPSENPTSVPQTTAQATEIQNAEVQTPASQTSGNPAPALQASETETSKAEATEQPVRANENPTEAITAAIPTELPPAEPESLPTELPPATWTPPAERSVRVPALNSSSPSPARTRDASAIEFGQPLPGSESTSTASRTTARETPQEGFRETVVAVNSTSGVLLPSGTVLSLRYQGEETLNLSSDYPLQEVLVVDRDVRNQEGQIIVPAGSQVIGRFETGSSGSEFIAQAISIDGESFLLNGRSNKLSGDRQLSSNQMMQNSAVGAVAGTLLGAVTGVGLIAGIAAGATTSAATTYLTAPQPAIIEPNRVVEVRLFEDLRQPGYGIGG